uniref:uncharacterized protein LOC122585954 n=1 Tax=Erigeron canadensis TaxID=72917 RepID=UPI001CB93C95|nr:uncharacterized protein LOC122585954 [Erigeron canadensis]
MILNDFRVKNYKYSCTHFAVNRFRSKQKTIWVPHSTTLDLDKGAWIPADRDDTDPNINKNLVTARSVSLPDANEVVVNLNISFNKANVSTMLRASGGVVTSTDHRSLTGSKL